MHLYLKANREYHHIQLYTAQIMVVQDYSVAAKRM
jgi:hypothetical protein